jgi:hypothetical protein
MVTVDKSRVCVLRGKQLTDRVISACGPLTRVFLDTPR